MNPDETSGLFAIVGSPDTCGRFPYSNKVQSDSSHKTPVKHGSYGTWGLVVELAAAAESPPDCLRCSFCTSRVSEDVIRDLVRVGILKDQECKHDLGCRTIMGESLRRLRLRLLTIREPDGSATVPIAQAAKALETFGWGYGEITKAVLDGRLRAAGKAPSSFDLHIYKRDMDKLQRKLAQNQFRVGAKWLARATGVAVKHVGNWIEAGLLEHKLARGGSPFDLSTEELAALMEKYVGYKAAAEIIGIPWPTLVEHVRAGRIRSVGPANRLRTTGLLYREDVNSWSPQFTMTEEELLRDYPIDAKTLDQIIRRRMLLPICGRGVDSREVRLFLRSDVEAYFSKARRSA